VQCKYGRKLIGVDSKEEAALPAPPRQNFLSGRTFRSRNSQKNRPGCLASVAEVESPAENAIFVA
jgi:hypothetical protein